MSAILYYSSQCEHCQKLLKEYNTNGLNLVNIDVKSFPNYVQSVPSIEHESKLHVGKAAFEYVKNNDSVEPFGFELSNNMNSGFSFVDNEHAYYCEPDTYTTI